MKSKILVLILIFMSIGCVDNASPEYEYHRNASDLSKTVLLSKENDCNCILEATNTPEKNNASQLEIILANDPQFNKNKLKNELAIDNDSIFANSNELSKSFELSDTLKKKFHSITVHEIILARKDSSALKKLFKKCPNSWMNVGPAIFNENYTRAIIPVNREGSGNLQVYYKIKGEWKFIKAFHLWIA